MILAVENLSKKLQNITIINQGNENSMLPYASSAQFDVKRSVESP